MLVEILKAIFIGIVEGITEWLPISSTGHMIIVDEFVQLDVSDEFLELFLVVIQIGAIMAVVTLYFTKLNPFSRRKTPDQRKGTWRLWGMVVVGCIPAAVVGLLFDDWVNEHFYNAVTVATMLIVYGVVFIAMERRNRRKVQALQAAKADDGGVPADGSPAPECVAAGNGAPAPSGDGAVDGASRADGASTSCTVGRAGLGADDPAGSVADEAVDDVDAADADDSTADDADDDDASEAAVDASGAIHDDAAADGTDAAADDARNGDAPGDDATGAGHAIADAAFSPSVSEPVSCADPECDSDAAAGVDDAAADSDAVHRAVVAVGADAAASDVDGAGADAAASDVDGAGADADIADPPAADAGTGDADEPVAEAVSGDVSGASTSPVPDDAAADGADPSEEQASGPKSGFKLLIPEIGDSGDAEPSVSVKSVDVKTVSVKPVGTVDPNSETVSLTAIRVEPSDGGASEGKGHPAEIARVKPVGAESSGSYSYAYHGGKHVKDPETGKARGLSPAATNHAVAASKASASNDDTAPFKAVSAGRKGRRSKRVEEQPEAADRDAGGVSEEELFKITDVDQIDAKTAFKIGLFQVLAIIPGTSRSGATIIGGMLSGASRSASAEFTFFLAIPVMLGWGLLKAVKFFMEGLVMTQTEIAILVVGVLVAFVTSVLSIKFLMGYIKRNDFTAFGVYRIIVGVVLLVFFGATGQLMVMQ